MTLPEACSLGREGRRVPKKWESGGTQQISYVGGLWESQPFRWIQLSNERSLDSKIACWES